MNPSYQGPVDSNFHFRVLHDSLARTGSFDCQCFVNGLAKGDRAPRWSDIIARRFDHDGKLSEVGVYGEGPPSRENGYPLDASDIAIYRLMILHPKHTSIFGPPQESYYLRTADRNIAREALEAACNMIKADLNLDTVEHELQMLAFTRGVPFHRSSDPFTEVREGARGPKDK